MFGFLRDITTLTQEFSTKNIAFCFDRPSTKRKALYAGYKSGRERKRNQMSEDETRAYHAMLHQIRKLEDEILPKIGFVNIFSEDGYEADDMIASVVRFGEDHSEIVVVSADQDLYQCLSDTVSIYNPTQRKQYTLEQFEEQWRVTPNEWAFVKAIAGCKSDDIPGVPGVGEATAVKYVREEMKHTSDVFNRIVDHAPQIKLNYRLVRLPFKGTPVCSLTKHEIDRIIWNKMVKSLGMTSLTRPDVKFRE
jgi:DNA polymerase-1